MVAVPVAAGQNSNRTRSHSRWHGHRHNYGRCHRRNRSHTRNCNRGGRFVVAAAFAAPVTVVVVVVVAVSIAVAVAVVVASQSQSQSHASGTKDSTLFPVHSVSSQITEGFQSSDLVIWPQLFVSWAELTGFGSLEPDWAARIYLGSILAYILSVCKHTHCQVGLQKVMWWRSNAVEK